MENKNKNNKESSTILKGLLRKILYAINNKKNNELETIAVINETTEGEGFFNIIVLIYIRYL